MFSQKVTQALALMSALATNFESGLWLSFQVSLEVMRHQFKAKFSGAATATSISGSLCTKETNYYRPTPNQSY